MRNHVEGSQPLGRLRATAVDVIQDGTQPLGDTQIGRWWYPAFLCKAFAHIGGEGHPGGASLCGTVLRCKVALAETDSVVSICTLLALAKNASQPVLHPLRGYVRLRGGKLKCFLYPLRITRAHVQSRQVFGIGASG